MDASETWNSETGQKHDHDCIQPCSQVPRSVTEIVDVAEEKEVERVKSCQTHKRMPNSKFRKIGRTQEKECQRKSENKSRKIKGTEEGSKKRKKSNNV